MSSEADGFEPSEERSLRPIPFWADAFMEEAMDLGTEEVGSYMLILAAMWSRRSCDFPDDDLRLAQVCRVSPKRWKARIGPRLRPLFHSGDGMLRSKRLTAAAENVERALIARKAGAERQKGETPPKDWKGPPE